MKTFENMLTVEKYLNSRCIYKPVFCCKLGLKVARLISVILVVAIFPSLHWLVLKF